MVFLLLSSNADPNSLNGSGNTPLIALVKGTHPPVDEIIRLLVRFGADVTVTESGGSQNTVFHLLNERMIPTRLLVLLSSCSPSTPFTALNANHQTASKVAIRAFYLCLRFTPALLLQMARNRASFLWKQLWMFHYLPSWLPILSTAVNCLLFLLLIDSLGWIYGLLAWTLLTFLFFDKLAQGLLETGIYRVTQGMVCGYYLSVLWIHFRYFGGVSFVSSSASTPSSSQTTGEVIELERGDSSEEGKKEEGGESPGSVFFFIGRNISSESTVNLSSFPTICLLTCALTLITFLFTYLASVSKVKNHTSTEDRSPPIPSALSHWPRAHLLSRIIRASSPDLKNETEHPQQLIDSDSSAVNFCPTCLIDQPIPHCPVSVPFPSSPSPCLCRIVLWSLSLRVVRTALGLHQQLCR
jgi:hypothetical protein